MSTWLQIPASMFLKLWVQWCVIPALKRWQWADPLHLLVSWSTWIHVLLGQWDPTLVMTRRSTSTCRMIKGDTQLDLRPPAAHAPTRTPTPYTHTKKNMYLSVLSISLFKVNFHPLSTAKALLIFLLPQPPQLLHVHHAWLCSFSWKKKTKTGR